MPRAAMLVACVVAGGCHTGLSAPDLAPPDLGPPTLVQKVDILVMMDNSPGTSPKQNELRKRFPQLVKALDSFASDGHPASYHIGVVTSDVGAGPYSLNNGQCHPGGDGGKLRTVPMANANPPAPAACASLDLGGVNFIAYDQLSGTNNVGGLDLPTAFNCIAVTGTGGCGFEAPLESVYRALHDAIPENHDFLRPDALLVVLYMTDEDDCSGPPDDDLFDPNNPAYGVEHSFRCTQYGITCGFPAGPLDTTTPDVPLLDCRPLRMFEGGKLIDVEKYISFFTQPAERGGVKVNPADVVVAGIFAPPEPFAYHITSPCADQTNTPSCPFLKNSCVSAANSQFFADPGVRMTAVVRAAPTWNIQSICDTDYTPTMDWIAQKIAERVQ